ncbi:sulfotransferase domain-containing protein [Roseibacillus ishigakijimensis]|uniref:Sulfotransferase domain-containing protein n=1 Tax=Roseibacillus ishigakijimensis TaxID=454146 RepID=A0A934RQX2_9BACT|nr:sulfotransferase domain-containing protein [Roseibacillus ishigakijimensis]MBK1833424.1 sulfotransferase domain-containing protein [Roseibacillus ishigakijimensis]
MRNKIKQALIKGSPRLYTQVSRAVAYCDYRAETRLIKGRSANDSGPNSILYFTYYRCGSQVFKKVLQRLFRQQEKSLSWIDFEAYLMHREPEKGNIEDRIGEFLPAFRKTGYFYGPHYHPVRELIGGSEIRSFCLLRDPRDVLVSHYYSLGFAHTVTNMKAVERRKEVASMSVDEFVLHPHFLGEIKDRYRVYLDEFYQYGESERFFRYEDMTRNMGGFLAAFASSCQLDVSLEDIEKVCQGVITESVKENKISHRRSGKWGQFRSKLEPETLERLEEELGDLLEPWRDLSS